LIGQPRGHWLTTRSQPDERSCSGKPTCSYCTRLRKALRHDDRVIWVNVWVDSAANAEVRRLNGGDEYTPTAIIGDRVLRNPTAALVRSTLS
jgi:mycoredoxin